MQELCSLSFGFHLLTEAADQIAITVAVIAVKDGLAARWTKISLHRRD